MIELKNGMYAYDSFELFMDFTVAKGMLVAVLGPSGAGKSTLLSIIAGFEPLARGALVLDGRDASPDAPHARPVSMVFQDNNVFAHLSAWANVALGISPALRLTKVQRDVVDLALDRTGLAQLADRRPGEMSGGERQRIALARVLVRDKPILLLDEPFAALGPGLKHDMLDLVSALHHEKRLTTLMVTHSPEDAKRIADHVIFVDAGIARVPVPTATFFSQQSDAAVRRYLG